MPDHRRAGEDDPDAEPFDPVERPAADRLGREPPGVLAPVARPERDRGQEQHREPDRDRGVDDRLRPPRQAVERVEESVAEPSERERREHPQVDREPYGPQHVERAMVGAGAFDLLGGEGRCAARAHGTSRRAVTTAPTTTNASAHSTSTSPPTGGERRSESLDPLNASLAALGVKRPTSG